MNIAINGFGRIGRTFLRILSKRRMEGSPLKVVAINLGPNVSIEDVAYYCTYDTVMGTSQVPVYQEGDQLIIADQAIQIYASADPQDCAWGKLNVDWVVDCSGKFTKNNAAQAHIKAGARAVLLSAPAQSCDITIIPGINDTAYNPKKHTIVSLGSCTTNALLPLLHVLDSSFGIDSGCMTTIHAYTNSQKLIDVDAKNPRISRAAGLNIIPTTTGASKVLDLVMPHLKGKIHALSLRVPVAKGSLIDLSVNVEKETDTQGVLKACTSAADSYLKSILSVTHDPIVSVDCWNSDYSVIVDGQLCHASGRLVKLFGWYDNEWGYSCRLVDFLHAAHKADGAV